MAKTTRQVQNQRRSRKLPDVPPELRRALEKDLAERLDAEGYPVFLKAQTGERHYPGEAEGLHLISEIKASRGPKKEALLRSLGILTNNSRAEGECARLRRTVLSAGLTLGLARQGLVVQPVTNEGRTAFALLSLFEQKRLSRLRRCLHCREWFFARFKHQQFCWNPVSKCQWNHYHTPEWRKRNRERNRRHQRAYRKRLFGE